MKTSDRKNGDGIRTAKALLELIDEHSAEDFRAAESILGGQKELAHLLKLLRQLKDQNDAQAEPVTIDTLRELVRRELLHLPLDKNQLADIAQSLLGLPPPNPASATREDMVGKILDHIDSDSASSIEEVDRYLLALNRGTDRAGPEHHARIVLLLRDLAMRALCENVVLFPTLHSLSRLRLIWAENPLAYFPRESRERFVTRLIEDLQKLTPEEIYYGIVSLLQEGLRGPADGAIAEVRRMSSKTKSKKAHGA